MDPGGWHRPKEKCRVESSDQSVHRLCQFRYMLDGSESYLPLHPLRFHITLKNTYSNDLAYAVLTQHFSTHGKAMTLIW